MSAGRALNRHTSLTTPDLEERLLCCFRGVFPMLSDDDIRVADMRRIGRWDSRALLLLLARIEREFALKIDHAHTRRLTSFQSILELLEGCRTRSMSVDNLWLTVYDPRPAADVRLLCFPQAGSSAAAYREWGQLLPESIELCTVEYPGRGRRRTERPFVRLHALVAAALAGIRPTLDRPFAIFGHCMGALVGFELLRQLQRRGGPTAHALFIAGCAAPSRPPRRSPTYAVPDDQLLAHLRSRDGMPEAYLADPHFVDLFLPPLRADLEVVETYNYRPGERLRCPLFVLAGASDGDATAEEIDAWSRETEWPHVVRRYDGDHRFLQTTAHRALGDVSSDLRALLPEVAHASCH
jgi:medium-chain acyl-[acyl-carrier-protein] hydrolase